jgi:hypothetical protein
LLCGMEQARRSALAHHVHRTAPMGPRVLINGIWYKRELRRLPVHESGAFHALKQVDQALREKSPAGRLRSKRASGA